MSYWQSILWIILVAGIFWSIYARYDRDRKLYIDHSIFTSFYFLFSSAAIIVAQPFSLNFLRWHWGIMCVISVVLLSFLIYKWLHFFYHGPKEKFETTHQYFLLLDPKYILPKLCEVFFQQTFIGAVISILLLNNLSPWLVFIIASTIFVLAHFSIFILQNKTLGEFYFKWSLLGAPIFTFIILATQTLWFTIALHLLFYTTLSWFAWHRSHPRYPWLVPERRRHKN